MLMGLRLCCSTTVPVGRAAFSTVRAMRDPLMLVTIVLRVVWTLLEGLGAAVVPAVVTIRLLRLIMMVLAPAFLMLTLTCNRATGPSFLLRLRACS